MTFAELIDNGVIVHDVNNFDLKETFECGQCFRWYKYNQGYIGIVHDKVLEVYKEKNNLIILNINLDEFMEYYWDYFDLKRDYSLIIKQLKVDSVLNPIIPNDSGIRLLKQDFIETVISFIISANNNIPRIKKCIEALCLFKGTKINYKDKTYYSFPSIDNLATMTESDFKSCGLGYRSAYLVDTTRFLARFKNWNTVLDTKDYSEATDMLCTLKGVGIKVADCICLFSLAKYEAFPVDVWIKRIMQNLYHTSDNIYSIKEFAKYHFKDLSGFAQQYLYYYLRSNK